MKKYLIIFLIFSLPYFSLAQIVIEERVEINSSTIRNNPSMNPLSVFSDSGFVIGKSGYLKVDYSSHYSYLYHYDEPMPDYSTFNAYFLKDGSLKIDSLMRRFSLYRVGTHNYYDYCNSSYLQRTRYFYRGENPELYNLGYVEEGDTVRFSYTSDSVGTGTPYTYEITDAYGDDDEGWVFDVYQVDNCFQMGVNGFSILVNIDSGYELVVSVEPEVLGADDTANVIIKYKDAEGTLYDFPAEQTFELAVLDGCVNGNFMVDGVIDVYFADAVQPIKFVTADELDPEFNQVLIRVGTDLSGYNRPIGGGTGEDSKLTEKQKQLKTKYEKLIAEKKVDAEAKRIERGTEPQAPLVTVCASGEPTYQYNDTLNISTEEEATEILLGETKYFQAKRNTETNKLKIEEITPDANGVPQQKSGTEDGWEWLTNDVWVNNPVSVVECDSCGEKMGVYWEKKYPQYGNRTYENGFYAGRKFNGMGQLEPGLIRVIGRFWSPDSTYQIKLRAIFEDDSIYIKIVVNSPATLLDSEQTPAFRYYVDVNDSLWNIDSLCILYGGKLGIPPHFIKGHAFREAAHPDTIFTPSFRYEPYSIQYWPTLEGESGRFYFKDTASVDYSDVPQHNNVNYMDYIREVKTVWNMIEEYSQLVYANNPTQYGNRKNDHTMNFDPKSFKTIQDKYDEFLKYYENFKKLTRPTSADSANVAMVNWFKKDWTKYGSKAEPEKKIAQTRAASSYGLLQMIYTTAVWKLKTYIKNKVPEEMNENIFFYQSLIHQKNKLKKYLGSSTESGNNWNDGYEMSFVKSIFDAWNESEGYGRDIVKKSTRFLPK